MEADADLRRYGAGGAQQRRRVFHGGAELAGQVVDGRALGHGEADEQAEVLGAVRLLHQLFQLFRAVEREVADAVVEIRLMDGARRLDRVHVMDLGVREHLAHQTDFAGGSRVEVADAAFIQGAHHGGFRIALHRIQHIAGEGGDEARGRGRKHGGAQAMHRIGREHRLDQIIDASHLLADGRGAPAETGGAAAERGNGGTETKLCHDASSQRPRRRRQTQEVKTSPYGQTTAGKDELWGCVANRATRRHRRKQAVSGI